MNLTTTHPGLQTLELVNSRLALESVALESFSDTVKKLVPSISASVRSFVSSFRYKLSDADGRTTEFYNEAEFAKLVKLLDSHKYTNLMELRLYVPEGFKGNITEYAKTLQRAQAHVNKVLGDVVIPYNVFLSKLVTNPNAAKDTRLQLTQLNQIKAAREFLRSQLAEFFMVGSTASYCKIGDAVSNNAEWSVLADTLKLISADFDMKRPEQVKDAVEDTSELLDALSNSASDNGLRDISSQTLRTLGDATLEVAREIEFFSIINYQVNTLMAVMGQNTVFLRKALK